MPREINCDHCHKKIMEVSGQIAPGSVALCLMCWRMYKSAYNLSNTKPKADLPDELKNIFGRFI